MKYSRIVALLTLGSFLLISVSVSGVSRFYNNNEPFAFGQYPVIDRIKCESAEHFNFHYHAHLDIFVIGFVPCSCRNRYQAARLHLLVAHS